MNAAPDEGEPGEEDERGDAGQLDVDDPEPGRGEERDREDGRAWRRT